jgi:radical SAM protein with 4Fe4S-binding SPASM domain
MSADDFQIDGHKLFWHLDRVAAWQAGEQIAPIYVEISPVSFCNHRCVFCGLDFAREQRLSLDTDAACHGLADMARLGVRSVMFAGEGEPLLHPGLGDMVTAAKRSGLDVSITTNGSAGNGEIWRKLTTNLTWLRFSVDAGQPETYSKVHGTEEKAFTSLLNNIEKALAVRNETGSPCTVGVQFLLVRESMGDIEEAIRLFGEMGVDYLSFKPFSEHPQMINKNDFACPPEKIDEIQGMVDHYRDIFPNTRLIFRKAATDVYAAGHKAFSHCHAMPFWGYISSKGDFYTCSVFLNDKRFNIGNIYHDNMSDIIFGVQRKDSLSFGAKELSIGHECRVNCRMARINEFLEFLTHRPEHLNFI